MKMLEKTALGQQNLWAPCQILAAFELGELFLAMAAAFATTTPWLLKASSLGGFKGPQAVLVRAAAGPEHAVPTGADEDDWYEVPVHKVTVKDRQKGVTHSFFVPEVRVLSSRVSSSNLKSMM